LMLPGECGARLDLAPGATPPFQVSVTSTKRNGFGRLGP
jgi:hypothetical protein